MPRKEILQSSLVDTIVPYELTVCQSRSFLTIPSLSMSYAMAAVHTPHLVNSHLASFDCQNASKMRVPASV
jgi:hypothetical protein